MISSSNGVMKRPSPCFYLWTNNINLLAIPSSSKLILWNWLSHLVQKNPCPTKFNLTPTDLCNLSSNNNSIHPDTSSNMSLLTHRHQPNMRFKSCQYYGIESLLDSSYLGVVLLLFVIFNYGLCANLPNIYSSCLYVNPKSSRLLTLTRRIFNPEWASWPVSANRKANSVCEFPPAPRDLTIDTVILFFKYHRSEFDDCFKEVLL